ncbi:MAG: hypothetical protein R6U00_04450 [Prochlorococcaceae cyanobacterium]
MQQRRAAEELDRVGAVLFISAVAALDLAMIGVSVFLTLACTESRRTGQAETSLAPERMAGQLDGGTAPVEGAVSRHARQEAGSRKPEAGAVAVGEHRRWLA